MREVPTQMTKHLMERLLMGCGESLRSALLPTGGAPLQRLRLLSGRARCDIERRLSAFRPGSARGD